MVFVKYRIVYYHFNGSHAILPTHARAGARESKIKYKNDQFTHTAAAV